MYEGKMNSEGAGLVWQGPVGGEKGDVIEAGLVLQWGYFLYFSNE